ncbi:MAG TPA: lysophospholipid acyltransferase family protein [Acidimicrobiales bacterium]|nr:lysophospholipid acyltransferase family protein [Acidimicrobiales bacterium]
MADPGAGRMQDVVRSLGRPVHRFFWKVDVEGLYRLPPRGGAILCPNHISFLDSAFLMLCVPRRISFVGKAEYMDSWKTKYIFPAMGMIPIDRSGGRSSDAALQAASSALARGDLFGIFPEGTRSRSGLLHKGHTGAARLALSSGCPIFPVGVIGTAEIQPPDAKMPKLFKSACIRIGQPIDVARYKGREGDHLVYRELTDELMYEIRELTGQQYVDKYATKKAETLPSDVAKVRLGEPVDAEPELARAG